MNKEEVINAYKQLDIASLLKIKLSLLTRLDLLFSEKERCKNLNPSYFNRGLNCEQYRINGRLKLVCNELEVRK